MLPTTPQWTVDELSFVLSSLLPLSFFLLYSFSLSSVFISQNDYSLFFLFSFLFVFFVILVTRPLSSLLFGFVLYILLLYATAISLLSFIRVVFVYFLYYATGFMV